jgi:hypothetical protein
MNYLSFNFSFPWIKNVAIIVSIIVNIILVIYFFIIIAHGNLESSNAYISIGIIVTIILFSSYYDYFLYVSKPIIFDETYLYILGKKEPKERIPLSSIVEVKRGLHYFYLIRYENMEGANGAVYFFISPNPPFTKPSKLKLLLSLIEKEKLKKDIIL